MKRAILFLSAALMITACARSPREASQPGTTSDYYAVKIASAAFYSYGPQQPNGPDRQLPRDTLLTILRKYAGFARVRLTTGEEGFIAKSDIWPAPSFLQAKHAPSPTPVATLKYSEPNLPPVEATPAVEPTAIPEPSP